MKLKSLLTFSFLMLTLIPIAIISFLLYKSGFDLSTESYTRNLIESINVQVDYISQNIENNMVSDSRFAIRNCVSHLEDTATAAADTDVSETANTELYTSFQSYLESSEDKISVCMLLDKNGEPVYTIGEESVIDRVNHKMPDLSQNKKQILMEFELSEGTYSLGIVTPVTNAKGEYIGSLLSIYDKSYIFKIISSYYEIADTSTYICRKNGDIVSFRGLSDEYKNAAVEQTLAGLEFDKEAKIDTKVGNAQVSGYYKRIYNSPWYLVGIIDNHLIYSFTNQFVWIYILIIAGVLAVDIVLSLYISNKVVKPINGLIDSMDRYKNNLLLNELQSDDTKGYVETQYLKKTFFSLMNKISLVQHNFEGIYQLYQSSIMDDTNIEIDTKNQTAVSNKEPFQALMDSMELQKGDCVVERLIHCFSSNDRKKLRKLLEDMRDKHLSTAREAEVYTPYLNQKWFHIMVVPMYENDRLSRLFVQLRDISNFKKQEIESLQKARRDSLTELNNRSGFIECVSGILESDDKTKTHGLLFIDIDYFKLVNDNFGHARGDELLCEVSRILVETVSDRNIVSRFGGDEFAVFLVDTSIEDIEKMKNELKRKLIFPFEAEKMSFVVSASIGVSVWNNADESSLEQMVRQADAAMYQAKREFKKDTEK